MLPFISFSRRRSRRRTLLRMLSNWSAIVGRWRRHFYRWLPSCNQAQSADPKTGNWDFWFHGLGPRNHFSAPHLHFDKCTHTGFQSSSTSEYVYSLRSEEKWWMLTAQSTSMWDIQKDQDHRSVCLRTVNARIL